MDPDQIVFIDENFESFILNDIDNEEDLNLMLRLSDEKFFIFFEHFFDRIIQICGWEKTASNLVCVFYENPSLEYLIKKSRLHFDKNEFKFYIHNILSKIVEIRDETFLLYLLKNYEIDHSTLVYEMCKSDNYKILDTVLQNNIKLEPTMIEYIMHTKHMTMISILFKYGIVLEDLNEKVFKIIINSNWIGYTSIVLFKKIMKAAGDKNFTMNERIFDYLYKKKQYHKMCIVNYYKKTEKYNTIINTCDVLMNKIQKNTFPEIPRLLMQYI